MTALPARNIFDGSSTPTTSAMKSALGALRDYLAEQLGTTGGAPTAISSINTGQLAGLRNKVINGGFKVDQRNNYASQTITAAAALAYTADRWYAYSTGANVTGQVVPGAAQSQKRYQFTGAAGVTSIGIGTRLEAKDTFDLNNKTITISADLANSTLTTVNWSLSRATTTDDTFGTLAAPTVTAIASGSFTVNSTVARYSTQVTLPSSATTGLQLVFSVGAQVSGNWTIGDVQMEIGAVATPFEQRPYQLEDYLCKRYYQICYFSFDWYVAVNSQIGRISVPISPMRATPSFGAITFTNSVQLQTGTITPISPTMVQVTAQATAASAGGNLGCTGSVPLTSEL